MHSLLYYVLQTPSFDKAWGMQAQARADLAAATSPERRRLPRPRPFARRAPAAKPCPAAPC